MNIRGPWQGHTFEMVRLVPRPLRVDHNYRLECNAVEVVAYRRSLIGELRYIPRVVSLEYLERCPMTLEDHKREVEAQALSLGV